jgi:hypothetical protein
MGFFLEQNVFEIETIRIPPLKVASFTMFNLWQFGFDVQQVMTTRILLMLTGELTSREAHRMFTEKQAAYSDAHIVGVNALLTGGPVKAIGEMAEVYRRSVSANCSRLSTQS